jgi:hypothetical protein
MAMTAMPRTFCPAGESPAGVGDSIRTKAATMTKPIINKPGFTGLGASVWALSSIFSSSIRLLLWLHYVLKEYLKK